MHIRNNLEFLEKQILQLLFFSSKPTRYDSNEQIVSKDLIKDHFYFYIVCF